MPFVSAALYQLIHPANPQRELMLSDGVLSLFFLMYVEKKDTGSNAGCPSTSLEQGRFGVASVAVGTVRGAYTNTSDKREQTSRSTSSSNGVRPTRVGWGGVLNNPVSICPCAHPYHTSTRVADSGCKPIIYGPSDSIRRSAAVHIMQAT